MEPQPREAKPEEPHIKVRPAPGVRSSCSHHADAVSIIPLEMKLPRTYVHRVENPDMITVVNTEGVDFANIISLKFGAYQTSSAPAAAGKKRAAFDFCGSDEEDGPGVAGGETARTGAVYKRPIIRGNKKVRREHK